MSHLDPIEDLADERLSSASEAERQLRAQEDETDLKWLIADPRGRRHLRRELASRGVFRSSFTGDALTTAFREGERNAGLVLLHRIMRAAPANVAEILKEEDNAG